MSNNTVTLDDGLPTLDTFPDFSFWDNFGMVITHDASVEGMSVVGTVTSFQVIPEPATILLLGLGAITALRRKK